MAVDQDLQAGGEQAEEALASSDMEQSENAGAELADIDWSLNDVDEVARPHVEKAVKHYQSKVTPKLQRLKELESAEQQWQSRGAQSQQEMQKLQKFARQLLEDDKFRGQIRQQMGVGLPQSEYPEEWNAPEMVRARQLLLDEQMQQLQQVIGFPLSDLRSLKEKAEKADAIELNQANDEIQAVTTQLKKEKLPFDDAIFNDCCAVISNAAQNGQRMGLRQAYDRLIGRGRQVEQSRIASQQQRQQGPKPFQPSGPGGKDSLSGDARLASIIDSLPGAEGLPWSG